MGIYPHVTTLSGNEVLLRDESSNVYTRKIHMEPKNHPIRNPENHLNQTIMTSGSKDDDYPIIYRVGNHPRWLLGILSIKSIKPTQGGFK